MLTKSGMLIDAAQRGDTAVISVVLHSISDAAEVNVGDPQHGMTALHWACSCDEADAARLLIADTRVDRGARSTHGMTALHHAAVANAMRVLPILLADPAGFPVDEARPSLPLGVCVTPMDLLPALCTAPVHRKP